MNEKFYYIYNLQQALYMIQHRIMPLDMRKGRDNVYVKFLRTPYAEEIVQEWADKGKEML